MIAIYLFISTMLRGIICLLPFFILSFFIKVPKKVKHIGIFIIAILISIYFTSKTNLSKNDLVFYFLLDMFTTYLGVITLMGLGISLHNSKLCSFCKKYRKI
ncbi:hypothetical protein CSPB12327_06625 [Campylobacter sp. RM12327]|uniref:hypothetical protein n=1 Tax=Campylobacter sputorum TaxID=206 RepID=UPI000B792567|nr:MULTISPECIES: hypothetical protein [Campylobacter]ASM39551.1 hypothetical protein CSPB_0290 [Campylobacter sputorum]MBE7358688.1 hypothetical protein [Campylobacter sp. RM11302]MBF6669810.1 hypothetical protein [Campylobacter sp. RM12327]MBF6675012.1 hypothetical protein [Campylobacter sp. RM13538]MBF6676554.1 hypothetical protein [Campylobacter sp. RM12321]